MKPRHSPKTMEEFKQEMANDTGPLWIALAVLAFIGLLWLGLWGVDYILS